MPKRCLPNAEEADAKRMATGRCDLIPGCTRADFSLPNDYIYLSCASRSPMLTATAAVGASAVESKLVPWMIGSDDHEHQARRLFSELIGAEEKDIALTPCTSHGISLAARVLGTGLKAGDEILILHNTMSSNVYPWQRLCKQTGASLRIVPTPQDRDWTVALEALDWTRVKIAALPNCLWTDGSLVDLRRARAKCDEVGAKLVVDATQSLGAMPLSVQDVRPDFLTCSVHKWLFGAYGLSCLYVHPKYHKDPACEGLDAHEHNREGADGATCLPFTEDPQAPYSETFKLGAYKFDSGGRGNPVILPMFVHSIQQVLKWGVCNIAACTRLINQRIASGAERHGFDVLPPKLRSPHILGIRAPHNADFSMADVSAFLKTKRILISSRFGALRVAPHMYNTFDEVDQLIACLGEFVALRRTPNEREGGSVSGAYKHTEST